MTRPPTPEALPTGHCRQRSQPATVAARRLCRPGGNRGVPDPDVRGQFARSVARGARRRGRVRHSRRDDPAGLTTRCSTPRCGTSWSGTSRRRSRRDRYAQAPAKVGVCIATSGPGADEPGHRDRGRVHGLGADRRHHRPGDPGHDRHGRLPGGDIQGSRCRSPSTTSWSRRPGRSGDPGRGVPLASTGRPGPVLVDIPKDVLQEQTTFSWPPVIDLPGYRPTLHPHGKQIREAARLIAGPSARCSTSAAACSRRVPPTAEETGRADRHPVVTT